MARIYAFVNQKGGVGKTTSAINIAAYLAESGMRVLMADLDPQANATSAFGIDRSTLSASIYDVLLEQIKAADIVITEPNTGVDLLPSTNALAGAEVELVNLMAREYRLTRALETLDEKYDYILIDCPPSLGLLTLNALTAAKSGVIIPVQCEYLALEGLSQLTQTIDLVRQHLNRSLKIRGLILTMYDSRTKLSRQVVNEVREHFGDKVFRAIVPRNIRLSEAPSYGQPVSLYAPDSTGAFSYKVLAAELLQGDNTRKR
jgi:chromosome partitioning protein